MYNPKLGAIIALFITVAASQTICMDPKNIYNFTYQGAGKNNPGIYAEEALNATINGNQLNISHWERYRDEDGEEDQRKVTSTIYLTPEEQQALEDLQAQSGPTYVKGINESTQFMNGKWFQIK